METRKYFFQPDKKMIKTGFFMTDEEQNVVYEANVIKQPLIGAAKVSFVNHIANKTEDHKIGHVVTVEENGLIGGLSTSSYFKFDGKKIWDYLHEKDIRIDSSISPDKLGMSYIITLRGKEIASIKTSTPKGKSIITGRFWLDVETSEYYIDLAFLAAYAIAKTEQTFIN